MDPVIRKCFTDQGKKPTIRDYMRYAKNYKMIRRACKRADEWLLTLNFDNDNNSGKGTIS
jgi:hypothetical protein